ncbi:flavin monoamine oxidase family protein [Microbulbifer yueqingensis]|uniref:Monoamine oxidase n=1 Tax=Microbulbifer yueqingensis TaxID=658219 RepID=A0A1G9E289_9GAMM|nr:flavin monoamine oxidase family protein [Microbulbifer yueqingensis]SDK70251.1 monoamine oxidase [Microbulbifer yueqingensis]
MEEIDVAVLGAGISGLQAARLLRDRFSVRILEARDRVGGRLLNHTFANGDTVDIGGQWIGPGQDRMYRLVEELGAATWPLYDRGDNLLVLDGRSRRYRGTIPRINPLALADLGLAMHRFEKMARGLDPARPWAHRRAAAWDAVTLRSWIDSNCRTRLARQLFAIAVGAVFAAEPDDLSLLHALFYARSGDSLERLLAVTGGAQQDRIHGGTAGLCERMAAQLGDCVQLGSPAKKVKATADGRLRVDYRGGALLCERLIVAIPPNQALRIQFEPELPAWRDQLMQRMPAGSCIKCIARYERPFWRDEQLSGQVTSPAGPVRVSFDNSERGRESGLLMGFLEGDVARHYSGVAPDERRQAVLDCFARFFGERARHPLEYVDKDWSSDPWTRGCYAAFLGPGTWTSYGERLREPNGRIHWAGTESASQWYGYMEGALESAERAAREVQQQLERAGALHV